MARTSARKRELLGIVPRLQRQMMWYSGNRDTIFNTPDDCNNDIEGDDGSSSSSDRCTAATSEGEEDQDDCFMNSDDKMLSIFT